MKTCPDCGKTKPLDDFYKNRCRADGVQSVCKPCTNRRNNDAYRNRDVEATSRRLRKNRIRYRHGITVPQYEGYFLAAGYLCICGKEATELDHCHETGKIRRALCGNCNRALGLLEDNPLLAEELASYLRRHQPQAAPAAG